MWIAISGERVMSLGRFLGTLGTLLFAGAFLSASWAQNKSEPGPPYPAGSDIKFQWSYSCPSSKGCAFSCMGGGGTSGTSHVTKLTVYLGRMSFGTDENAFALFYDFSTIEFPRGNGFVVAAGLSSLSCQVNGIGSPTRSGKRTCLTTVCCTACARRPHGGWPSAGCTEEQIKAVTGHATSRMVAHYTKGANQLKLATAAILKLEKRTTEEP